MTALADVVEDRYSGKRYLVEVYPYDVSIGGVTTLRWSTSHFVTASFDDPPSEPYDERVEEITIRKEMFSGGALSGASGGSSGTIRLDNTNRELFPLLNERFNGLRRYHFKRRRVVVRAGGIDSSYLQHEVIFDGLISDAEFNQSDVVFTLENQLARLDNPLQTIRYSGNREQATSGSTINIAIGPVTVTLVEDDLTPEIGDEVWLCRTTDLDSFQMRGNVTAWDAGTKVLDVEVAEIIGTGNFAGWTVYIRPFEGGEDLKDQTKPVVIGSCPFVEPVFLGIIGGLYVFQASGDPCIFGSGYVGANTMTEVSYPPGAGEWSKDDARGLMHVASKPSRVITCDVESGGGAFLQTVTFSAAGSTSWVVPSGVTTIDVIKAWAAGGGRARVGAGVGVVGEGGGGGYSTITNVAVTPGETLTIIVGAGGRTPALSGGVIAGAAGGASAGGAGGDSKAGVASGGVVGGSGGGATAVLNAGGTLIVAGAGGGAGYSSANGAIGGAPGGGSSGSTPGGTINGGGATFVRPTGGTAGAVGVKGTVSGAANQVNGSDGSDSAGGPGGQLSAIISSTQYSANSAGAGGGLYGGGSGAGAITAAAVFAADAGAGGSGYAPSGTTTAGSTRFPGNNTDNDLLAYQPTSDHAPTGYGAWGAYTIGGNGQITMTYTAFLAADATPTIGACVREVCRRAGYGNTEFDDIAFEVADALQPAGVGLYVAAGEDVTFADAIQEICATDLFWINATANGEVTIGQVRDPAESGSPGTVLHLDRSNDLLDIVRLPADRSLWRRQIGAARCWRPHTQGEIHEDAAEANRLFVQSQYRQTSYEDPDALVRDASAADEKRDSLFLEVPPATVSAAREVSLFSPERDSFRLVTKLRPIQVAIGDEVSVTDETMDLSYTPALVTATELIASMNRTILTVWR